MIYLRSSADLMCANTLAAAAAAAATGYLSIVMLSTAVPGAPAIATPPEVFEELFQVSAIMGP
jgi:hypothetical protein